MNNEEKLTARYEHIEHRIAEIIGDTRTALTTISRDVTRRTEARFLEQTINKTETLKKDIERFYNYFTQEAKIEDTILQLNFNEEKKDNE